MTHTNTPNDDKKINKADIDLTDAEIEALLPTEEEKAEEREPMTEAEAEAEVNGDEPVDTLESDTNFNEGDEEEEKQQDPLQ